MCTLEALAFQKVVNSSKYKTDALLEVSSKQKKRTQMRMNLLH